MNDDYKQHLYTSKLRLQTEVTLIHKDYIILSIEKEKVWE